MARGMAVQRGTRGFRSHLVRDQTPPRLMGEKRAVGNPGPEVEGRGTGKGGRQLERIPEGPGLECAGNPLPLPIVRRWRAALAHEGARTDAGRDEAFAKEPVV